MNVRRSILSAHRWVSLFVAALWILQALTGLFSVFHWEIDDATVAGDHRPTNVRSIEGAISELAPPSSGLRVGSIWTSAGAPDRYDVNISAEPPAIGRVVRIDGSGRPQRVRNDGERFANGGWVGTVVVFHQSLLAGDRGRWLNGASGLLLLSNLVMGLVVAWPRAGSRMRSFLPSNRGSRAAKLFTWHRALGLWIALPAMVVICAGMILAFDQFAERALDPPPEYPETVPEGSINVGLADAVAAALQRYPDAEVSGIGFPTEERPLWALTLKQGDEPRRAYGKTRVFVSAVDGRVIAEFDALRAPRSRGFLNILFAIHTGEVAGLPGRIAVVAIGLWLLGMIVLGVLLFQARRQARLRT